MLMMTFSPISTRPSSVADPICGKSTTLVSSRKRGFTVPIIEWIGRHGARIGDLVAAQPGVLEVADAERVRALYLAKGKREGLAAWVLLFYALWHRRHVLGQVPDGDVFDVLSQAA